MIRWLFIALFIWLLYKLISGPRPSNRRKSSFFTFQTGHFPGNGGQPAQTEKKQDLDHIEEAEYEDITEDKES